MHGQKNIKTYFLFKVRSNVSSCSVELRRSTFTEMYRLFGLSFNDTIN